MTTAATPSSQLPPSAIAEQLLAELRSHANAENVACMARFGIASTGTLGVAMPVMRGLAREAKRRTGGDTQALHEIALELWASGVHEARIAAAMTDVPSLVTRAQAESWVSDVDSWDVCDKLCIDLLRRCDFAWDKAAKWSHAEPEFVKRAAFALGATLAVHEKAAPDECFVALLGDAERECTDERNMVTKAINWQMRSIGKRSAALNAAAIEACERMLATHQGSKAARWVARGALRELRSAAVRARLGLG